MLYQPFQRFPGQVQPVEIGIAMFQPGHQHEGLGVVVEAAIAGHAGIKRRLAGMTERRVAKIVSQGKSLSQILIQPKDACERAGDLRHFQ